MKLFYMLFLYFICYIPVLFLLAIMPYITRKTENFGVSIPAEIFSHKKVIGIRKNYRNKVLLYGGIFSVIALFFILLFPYDIKYLLTPLGTFVIMFISFGFYFRAHKEMKRLKAEENWTKSKSEMVVIDTGFRSNKTMASPLWFFLHISLVLATIVLGFSLYGKMPDKIPMGWDINGKVHTWANKSYKLLFFAPIMQLLMTFVMAFSYWMIGKSKQLVDAANPEKSIEQNKIFRYRWSLFSVFAGLALVVMFGFMLFPMSGMVTNPIWVIAVPVGVTLIILVASIVLSITTGQGGSRVYRTEIESQNGTVSKVVSRDEDKYWKLGLFYYNPDDPAFIVEKRFGVGWTNNWARPVSWIITIGLLGIIILVSVFSAHLAK